MIVVAWWGVGLGFVVGCVNGLVLAVGVLLSRVPRPPTRLRRRVLGLVGMVTTLGVLWVMQQLLGVIYQIPPADGPSLTYRVAAWVHFLLQLAGAAVAGWWVGGRVGGWAVAEIAAREE